MKKLYTFILLTICSITFGQENYLVENFEYTAGTLLQDNGWFAHSAGTTNPITVSDGGLSWTTSPYIGSNVGNAALVNNTGSDENKPLGATITTGDVYASFLFRVNADVTNEGFFFHYGRYNNIDEPVFTSLATAFRARTHAIAGSGPGQFKLALSFNLASPIAEDVTNDLNVGQTYLAVVKYSIIEGADNDQVSLYVFADGDDLSAEPATPSIGPLTGTASDIPIQAVALRQFNANQNITVDGIYVRTEWNLTSPGTALSVDNITENNQFKLYPNPSSNGFVTIQSNLSGEKEIEIYDLHGKSVFQSKTDSNVIDVQSLSTGLYLVKVTSDNVSQIKKLIIK